MYRFHKVGDKMSSFCPFEKPNYIISVKWVQGNVEPHKITFGWRLGAIAVATICVQSLSSVLQNWDVFPSCKLLRIKAFAISHKMHL